MTEKSSDPITVTLFVGKNTPLKRYVAYFGKSLIIVPPDDKKTTDIVLCHSLGIVQALKSDAKYIIAMDPTVISDDKRVINWIPIVRQYPVEMGNVIQYEMPVDMKERAHYPYESKVIRDKIIKYIQSLKK